MSFNGIKPIGDWSKQIKDPLRDALRASVEICGRTGAEACKHAIILMAQSAAALTKKSAKLRPIVRNPHPEAGKDRRRALYGVYKYSQRLGKYFVPIYRTGEFGKIFFKSKTTAEWLARDTITGEVHRAQIATGAGEFDLPGIKESKKRIIGRSGLAKKSWMWGLRELGQSSADVIPGVGTLQTFLSDKVCGYILNNALSYLLKILPAGWAQIVEQKAANKIMKQATMQIERAWLAEMRKARRAGMAIGGLSKYFLKAG